jgi:hypothetical protein
MSSGFERILQLTCDDLGHVVEFLGSLSVVQEIVVEARGPAFVKFKYFLLFFEELGFVKLWILFRFCIVGENCAWYLHRWVPCSSSSTNPEPSSKFSDRFS